MRALTERGDFRIDPYEFQPRWSTIDQVQVGGNLYSTKPAVLPVAAAVLTIPAEAVVGQKLADAPAAVTRAVLLALNLLPFAAALLAVRSLLTPRAADPHPPVAVTPTARFLALGALGFGTGLSAFLPVFNNHTVAASCCALATVQLVRIRLGRREGWRFAVAGFFAALTACNELPAGLFGLAALAVCGVADWRKTLLIFSPAAAVPVLLFAAATVWQTRGLKPFYMSYGTETYEFVRNGRPSYWMNPTGLDAARDGVGTYLFHCTLGHHGVFSLTPVWLLTAWGWVRGGLSFWKDPRADRHPLAGFAAATGVLSVAILGFYLTRTANYNYGGRSVALRWMLWLAPLWAVCLVPLADGLTDGLASRAGARPGRRWFAPLAAGLLGLSVTSCWADAPDPWQNPWLMRAMESRGWVDYAAAGRPGDATAPGADRRPRRTAAPAEPPRTANLPPLPRVGEASTVSPPPRRGGPKA